MPLPELVSRREIYAVKNLLRRFCVEEGEFEERLAGKTAYEWALHHKLDGLATEIKYYVRSFFFMHCFVRESSGFF